jgi:integrase
MSVRLREWQDRSTGQKREAWMFDVEYVHPDGRTQRVRQSGFDSEAAASKAEAKARLRLEDGISIRPKREPKEVKKGPKNFAEFADEFMRDYAEINNAPSTIASKKVILEKFLKPVFGKMNLDQIGTDDIDKFVGQHKRTGARANTIRNYLRVLRRILSLAVEYEVLARVPKVRRVQDDEDDRGDFKFLTFEQAERLLAGARPEPEWWTMILLALKTGMRQGEILALRWEHVDLDRGVIHVRRSVWEGTEKRPKSKKPRDIPISAVREALIQHQHERGPYVFCNAEGKQFTKQQCRRPLARALARAGLPHFGWHSFRHTFASHLVMKGVPLPAIQQLLGHSVITVTMRYAKVAAEVKTDAIALLDPKVTPTEESSGTPAAHGPKEAVQAA